MVQPSQIKGTRGPGSDQDYALIVLLLSAEGVRSAFMADRLPTLEQIEKAFSMSVISLVISRDTCWRM